MKGMSVTTEPHETHELFGTDATAKLEAQLHETPLRGRHEALGARMVPFAGWLMPIQYSGILQEHRAVREAAGLFDLGHMGQIDVSGPEALEFLQGVTTNDVSTLQPWAAQYSLLLNEAGGVIDDIIVYRRAAADGYMVVVNASNREKDVAWLQTQRQTRPDIDVTLEDISDRLGMIAIQGPKAEAIVRPLTEFDLTCIAAFQWAPATVAGIAVLIARTGYTGEDGFEFYPAISEVGALWDALLREGRPLGLIPVGLGARDTLRLEARMPLHGNEISEEIHPLEAGLGWAVKPDKGDFVGRQPVLDMKARKAPRRTVGFQLVGPSGAPRAGFEVRAADRPVGYVTSGAKSPTLAENIGLALIEREAAGVGKSLDIMIRGRPVPAIQVKLPFYRRPAIDAERQA